MATIPRAWIDGYVDGLTKVSDHMKSHLRLSLETIDWDRPVAEVREDLIAVFFEECRQGAGMASTLAAEFYDGIRQRTIGEALGAVSSDEYADLPAIDGAVRALVDPLAKSDTDDLDDAIDRVVSELCDRLGMEVRHAAGETLFKNGRRDPKRPRFARVPRGSRSYPNGCPWCQMIASRGFVYVSDKTAGDLDPHHYHDDCRCAIVPSWDKSPEVEGYDPKAYDEGYQQWLSADHSEHEANKRKAKGDSGVHGSISISDRIEANLSEEGWTTDIDINEAEIVAHAINNVYHGRYKDGGTDVFGFGDFAYAIEVHGFYNYTFLARRRIT